MGILNGKCKDSAFKLVTGSDDPRKEYFSSSGDFQKKEGKMKNWIYIVIWKRGRNIFVDGHCFKTLQEAQTYGNIESMQVEQEGCSFGIQSVELI